MTSWVRSNITWLALTLGVGLLVAAILMAALKVDWSRLGEAEPWHLASLAGCVAVNLLLSGLLWWSVTLSFDAKPRVPLGRMFALVCGSGLLNYLPLRPGLIGRAAFLKMKHNLPVRQSLAILAIIMSLAALVLGGAVAIVQFVPAYQYEVALAAAVITTLVAPLAAGRLLKRKIELGWTWVPLRLADMLINALRLWIAFAVVGQDLSLDSAVLAASAGSFVSLLGLTPNGLGMREWTIAGVTAASVGPIGFAAAVIDRGIEAIIVTIFGLIALKKVGLQRGEKMSVEDEKAS
ncbi:MAG: hypothetical protein WD768_07930 [Phycisphaeraceae bacterium]